MIRIQETENEYLLFIPAAQKQRAKTIKPRDWDRKRVCWVYPRTEHIYKSLLAEFGNDPTAKFSIVSPQPLDSQARDEGQSSEIHSLRDENSQLRVKIKNLLNEIEMSAGHRERKADDLTEKLKKKLQENAKLTEHNNQLRTENRKLTAAFKKSTNDIALMTSKVENRLQKKEQEEAKLTEHNNQLKTENRKLTTAIRKSTSDKEQMASKAKDQLRKRKQEKTKLTKHNNQLKAENRELTTAFKKLTDDKEQLASKAEDRLQKKEQEKAKLTEQKEQLKAENTKLSDKVKNLEAARIEAIPAPKRNGATDPTNRPNKSALSYAIDIFRDTMRPFVIKNLKRVPGATVEEAIMRSLSEKQVADFNRGLRQHSDLASAIDVNFFPQLVMYNWRDAFSMTFDGKRTIQNELWMISEARNDVSHPPAHDFEPDYTGAYLYIIADALERIKAPEQKQKVKKVREDWEKGLGWDH